LARVEATGALETGMNEGFEMGLSVLCEAKWTLLEMSCTASGVDTVQGQYKNKNPWKKRLIFLSLSTAITPDFCTYNIAA